MMEAGLVFFACVVVNTSSAFVTPKLEFHRRYSPGLSNILHCEKALEKTIIKFVPSVHDVNIGTWNDGKREVSYKSWSMGKNIIHEKLQVSNESGKGKGPLIFREVDRVRGPVNVYMVTSWCINEREGISVTVSINAEPGLTSRIVMNMMKKKIKNTMGEFLNNLP